MLLTIYHRIDSSVANQRTAFVIEHCLVDLYQQVIETSQFVLVK